MRFYLGLLILVLLAPANGAASDGGCIGEEPVVDHTSLWDMRENPRSDLYLPTRNSSGGYVTWAAAHLAWDGQLRISFDHILPPTHPFGIPYTVYRIEIFFGEERQPLDFDLTGNCSGPGLSLFPGGSVEFFPVKVPPRPDGQDRAVEPVRIRIWGSHS